MQRIVRHISALLFLCSVTNAHDYIVKIDKEKFNFRSTFAQDMSPLVPELGIYLVKTKSFSPRSVKKEVSNLRKTSGVIYAHLDAPVKMRDSTPDDPMFKDQWHHKNSKNNSHMSSLEAWKTTTGGKDAGGRDIVIAIVDGGVETDHDDLKENMWRNEGEIEGNGKDDDGNGYIDDIHGWNAHTDSGKTSPDRHGTHVAGIAAARGYNGIGVSGVNWQSKIMTIDGADQKTSVIVKAYGYALKMKKLWLETAGAKGANVVVTNSSFGVDYADCSSKDYAVWNDMYQSLGEVGILSAAATANIDLDVDVKGDVPTGCETPYIIAVTNTDNNDDRNAGAAYGKKSIDLGAPGTNILSTLLNNDFGHLTGTSMATPQVAGAVALMHAAASNAFNDYYLKNPGKAALDLKQVMLSQVDQIDSLKGITVSNGRLNLAKAVESMAKFQVK